MAKIQSDKLLHAFCGCIIALSLSPFNQFAAAIAVILIGGAKELYDHVTKRGRVELLDFIFTFLGGIAGLVIYEALNYIFN